VVDPAAEVPGVGEEQRGVEAVEEQTGDAAGGRVAVDVVVALEVVLAAEDGVVGTPGPADEVAEGQQDGHEDPDQDPEQGHPTEGGQPEDELRAPHPVEAAGLGRLDEADGGGDDDRGQHRQGEVAQQAGGEDQQQGDGDGADQRRELAAGAGRDGHRGARGAAGDGEALEEAGGQVASPQGPQLLVGVDGLAALGGQGLGQHGGVGHGDQGDPEGAAEQPAQVGQVDGREGEAREALGSTPMTFTPSWSRSNRATAAMPTTTATPTAGTAFQNRFRSRMTTMPVSPTARAARFTRPSATPWTKSLISVSSPRLSIEKPQSLGSWPTRMVTAMPHR
jgi:hypothetical protein